MEASDLRVERATLLIALDGQRYRVTSDDRGTQVERLTAVDGGLGRQRLDAAPVTVPEAQRVVAALRESVWPTPGGVK